MNNSKVYSILATFDKYEQNRFRKFLLSPFFNQNENLTLLFEIMIRHIQKEKEKELSKEQSWKKLHPDKKFNDLRFRKYLSELLKLAEKYLAQKVYEENPIQEITYLIKAVSNRKMEKLYNSSMKLARGLAEKQQFRNTEFYYKQYLTEKNYYDLTDFDTKRGTKSNVGVISNHLDAFYFGEKLRLSCEVLSRQTVKSHEYNLQFTEEITNYLKKNNYEHIPPVALYYQIYLLYKEPEDEDHYFKLKELLNKYALQFPVNEAKDELYMSAQNYCIKKINQGNAKFLKELFILYKNLLDRKILIAEGKLSPWYFRNIVVVALRLKEFSWAESFIKDYNQFLSKSFRENAVTFNLANLYFYQKEYDKVIEKLRNVEFEDFTYNLNSKTMLIATYYETEEIEPLYSLFESFRTYLNRHKEIPEERRKAFLQLIRFTKRLTKIMPRDKIGLKKLKDDVEATKGITNANWLKEKIAEME